MSDAYPSRLAEKIVVRLPDGLRDRLAQLAKENRRSVNAEVVDRLLRSIDNLPALLTTENSVPEVARNTGRALGQAIANQAIAALQRSDQPVSPDALFEKVIAGMEAALSGDAFKHSIAAAIAERLAPADDASD